VVVGVVAVVAILYIVLAGRKEEEVLTEETVVEEGEESPKVTPPKIEADPTKIRGIGPKWWGKIDRSRYAFMDVARRLSSGAEAKTVKLPLEES
jgi:hypothetical protein